MDRRPTESHSFSELNRTLLAAVVAALVFVAAVVLIDRVPSERASQTTPTASASATFPLPPEPTVVTNRLGELVAREGDTLTVSADTIVGNRLERKAYTIRTGRETRIESVDFRTPATTSATATRAAITLDDIALGAQVNAVASTNVVGLSEFAAVLIEHHLLPS